MPGASEPYIRDVDTLARTDDVVLEHIAPLGVSGVTRSHDVAAAGTVDLQCVAVEIDVTVVVDEVYGTLDN